MHLEVYSEELHIAAQKSFGSEIRRMTPLDFIPHTKIQSLSSGHRHLRLLELFPLDGDRAKKPSYI